jgi:excisionase family DNA binding protein
MSNERYYTIEEVAKLLRVHKRTIMRFIEAGQLHAIHVGRQYRISHSDLQKYLRSSGQQTPPSDEQP